MREDGSISIYGLGVVQAKDLTIFELEDKIYKLLVQKGLEKEFQMEIQLFLSKKIRIVVDGEQPFSFP